MNKNTAKSIANESAKSKIEIFGEELINFIHDNPDSVTKVSDTEWNVKKDGKEFVMTVEKNFAKSGRKCFKKTLYRVDGEKRRPVQFGMFRKKLLYKLFLLVEEGHRVGKKKIDIGMVKSLAEDIRVNKKNYSLDKEDLVGKFNNDEIRIKNVVKTNKAGKELIMRQLYVNGALATEGCLLNVPMQAFKAKHKSKKSAAEVLAEAEASVEDLI